MVGSILESGEQKNNNRDMLQGVRECQLYTDHSRASKCPGCLHVLSFPRLDSGIRTYEFGGGEIDHKVLLCY